MAELRIISADSHFVEPPTMWAERVDARFRDRALASSRATKTGRGSGSCARTSNLCKSAGFFGSGKSARRVT